MPLPPGISAVLLDIEGTTTPIEFVHDVLFPHAKQRLNEACAQATRNPELGAAIERLRAEHRAAAGHAPSTMPDFGDGAAYARWLMDSDTKSTGLKALQGLIWQRGYADGTLRSAVFPDVPLALQRWQDAGIRLRVFSSGSVLAQRLLFSHTDHGDLSAFFEGHHDTTTGPKEAAASYRAIADAYGLAPELVLFLSDVAAELDAAAEAGMATGLMLRPGNLPVPVSGHPGHPGHRDFITLA